MKKKQKPQKSELRLYNGLSIDLDPVNVCFTDALIPSPSEITKCLVVKNGNKLVKGCQVILEELEYQFKNEWIFPPNGFEQKALRWAGESESPDGKFDICINSSARIEIVRVFRFPNPFFGISYFDRTHGKTHHFIGTYKLRLRIEAKTINSSNDWSFEPTIYEVYLSYAGALDLEIEDITRVSTTKPSINHDRC